VAVFRLVKVQLFRRHVFVLLNTGSPSFPGCAKGAARNP
jgi:hypothetical protein